MSRQLFCFVCALFFARLAAAPDLKTALDALNLKAGLAITIGVEAKVDQALLQTAPGWLLLSLPGDSTAADTRREFLRSQDQGRAMVHPLLQKEVPLFPRAAGLVIVDADRLGDSTPSWEEIQRVLRPYGSAFVKRNGTWQSTRAPWPDSIAHYPHWLGDEGFSGQVNDQEIQQARSLRWQAARNEQAGSTALMSHGILIGQMKVKLGWKSNQALTAYDAFTGLMLWQRPDLKVFGNYALVMDEKRVVIPQFEIQAREHPHKAKNRMAKMVEEESFKPVALDIYTGETLQVYDEAPPLPMISRNASSRDMTFNLSNGKLIVNVKGHLAVLDADSGNKLWDIQHKGAVLFPCVSEGLLVVAQGSHLEASRAHGPNMDADVENFNNVIAYDLNSGKERWRWNPEEAGQERVRLTMLHQNAGSVWLDYDIRKRDWYLVRLNPKDGSLIWKTKHRELGPTDQFARAFVFDKHVFLSRGAQDGWRFDLESGKVLDRWSTLQGGCHAPRASSDFMFHSGVSVSGNGDQHQKHWAHMISGRCHLGAFPGHGMLVASDSGCDCDPFIRGMAAYGSEPAPRILSPMTVRGTGKPGSSGTPDNWSSGFRDARRSGWSTSTLSPALSNSWTHKVGTGSTGPDLAIRRYDITAGPMGAPTIAGKIAVVTRPHDHEVVGISLKDGTELWRHRAMGRLDGAASLAKGMAVFGSAAGWIEAVSLTDGKLIWKTLAAPGSRFRVRSGQVESTHPFLASVAVVGDTVYASGGMHTHVDGGIHFVALDLNTGALKDRTIYDGSPPLMDLFEKQGPHRDITINPRFSVERTKKKKTYRALSGTYPSTAYSLAYQEQQNGPLVITPEGWLGLGTLAYDPSTRTMKQGGIDLPFVSTGHNGHLHKNEARWPQQVRVGLLSRVESSGRGNQRAIFAGILGKAFAYREDRIISIESGTSGSWTTDRSVVSRHQWREHPTDLFTNSRSNNKPEVSAKQLWASAPRRKPKSSPTALAVCANRVLVSLEKNLFVYDLENGNEVQKIDLPASVPIGGIAIADGKVVVTCNDGSVLAFR